MNRLKLPRIGFLLKLLGARVAFCIVLQGASDLAGPSMAMADEEQRKTPYVFGVFPYLPPARLEQLNGPMAVDFAAALNRDVLFRTKKDFPNWFEEVKVQKYDIVLIQPFDYIKAFDNYGYLPLAKDGEPLFAVFMVRVDSPLTRRRDMRDKTLALPPARAAVSHLAKIALTDVGLEPGRDLTVRHFNNHDSCLQEMLVGAADACATSRAVVRNFTLKRSIDLRELAVTPSIPHVLFAVHARVPEDDRAVLKRVILGWQHTDRGRRLLANTGRKSYVEASDADYDIVRNYASRLGLLD